MKNDLALCVAVLVSACGAAPSPTDAGTDAGEVIAPAGTGDAGTLVGSFSLLHLVNGGTNPASSLFGKVSDGPTPAALVWELDTEDGDCRLLTPRVPFCSTPCGGSAVCVEDGVCQPYASSRPLGLVHVEGVLASVASFDMSPINNGYQPPAGVVLSVPPFTDGQALVLSARGSASVQTFSLAAQGVAPLTFPSTTLDLASGSPLELTWTPGLTSAAARVKVKLDISHHGGTRGMVTCDTADDGALTISATLVTTLMNLGVSGFPTVVLRREKVGSALITAGRVDLVVASELEQAVSIPGLISCTDTSECPPGQTCQNDLRCN